MPQLTYPILPRGLYVDVYVNLDAAILVPLHSSGQPSPNPVPARGLIDTGSDITVVSLPILQQLGVAASSPVSTQGLSGPVQGSTYSVSLHILTFADQSISWFTHPTLRVMGLPLGSLFDVLIGMDILLNCKLLLDGPGRQFTLEF